MMQPRTNRPLLPQATARPAIEVRNCQNGSLLVVGIDNDFQLSVQQVRILSEVYRDGEGAPSVCTRDRLHAAALNHRTLSPGPLPSCARLRSGAVLASSQRAALSRSLRRLHERGLIERSRTAILRTALGEDFMARLRALPNWKNWSRKWLTVREPINDALNNQSAGF